MKCYRCDSEWKTIKTIKYPKKCPYCGNDLPMLSAGENTIKYILQEKTEMIFENAEAYKGCLRDKLPNAEDELLECLLRAEAIKLHTYYKYATSNISNRYSLLTQARDELKKVCSDNQYFSQIEKMYENAFLITNEKKVKRDYYDCDQAYLNLAKQLEHQARYTDSFCVLLVSVDAGNSDAGDVICDNLDKVRFIDAGIDIVHVEEIINKILTSNGNIDYLKLANLYAYGDFRKLKNSGEKALAFYEASKNSDLAQAEMLIRRYMGYGAEENKHQTKILKQLCQNQFAIKTLHVMDCDCLETSNEFLLSNNERVTSIDTKLCYQMALYYWNNREYEKAYLFWLDKCISFQQHSNELLSIEQIMPIDIGELLERYRHRLPDDKFLFQLIYEYCEHNNLYDEGYLYFEYADNYGIDSDYGKSSIALYQSGLVRDGYECFVKHFSNMLKSGVHSAKKLKPKYSRERKQAEKYTYEYIIDNISSVDLTWIQHGCKQLGKWNAKESDKTYVAQFLLELLVGVGGEFLNRNEYNKSYEMLLAGNRIRHYFSFAVFDNLIENFYQGILENLGQFTLSTKKLEYLEKGKMLLSDSTNNKLKADLLRKLADEYRTFGWNIRFERLYKEATLLGDTIAKDYFINKGNSVLEDHGKLVKWIGKEKIISISDSITEIGRDAFAGNSFAQKVVIPDTVKKIGAQAFIACEQLTVIEIQGQIDTICSRAFADCNNLAKIVFKKISRYIEPDAFDNTLVLTENEKVLSVGGVLVGYKGDEETVWIQDGIEQIGANAFENTKVVSVLLPETLRRIGEYGFSNCRNLKSVILPETVKIVDEYAFRSSGVKDISLGSVEKIGKGAFENSKIESVRIPGTVELIEKSVFEFCSDLKEVWIDKGVKKIEEDAFYGCDKLTKVHIPHTVVQIDDNAFEGQKMKIYGVANSYANKYANRMGISFIAV